MFHLGRLFSILDSDTKWKRSLISVIGKICDSPATSCPCGRCGRKVCFMLYVCNCFLKSVVWLQCPKVPVVVATLHAMLRMSS